MTSCTIATHVGGYNQVSQEHNRRNPSIVRREDHIRPDGEFEIWKHETLDHAYERLFEKAKEEYNIGKKPCRQIQNYLKKVKDAWLDQFEKNKTLPKNKQSYKNPDPCKEMIIGVYGDNIPDDIKKKILREFYENWLKKYPTLEIIGAYLHGDETNMHLHTDYIPVCHADKHPEDKWRGLSVKVNESKALEEIGFKTPEEHYDKNTKKWITAQTLFEEDANKMLEKICEKYGLKVYHKDTDEKVEHQEKREYIATQKAEEAEKNLQEAEKNLHIKSNQLQELDQIYDAQNSQIKTNDEFIDEQEKTIENISIKKEKAENDLKSLTDELAEMNKKVDDVSVTYNLVEMMSEDEIDTVGKQNKLTKKFELTEQEYYKLTTQARVVQGTEIGLQKLQKEYENQLNSLKNLKWTNNDVKKFIEDATKEYKTELQKVTKDRDYYKVIAKDMTNKYNKIAFEMKDKDEKVIDYLEKLNLPDKVLNSLKAYMNYVINDGYER